MNKVVRLPNGKFITKVLRESNPFELAKAKPEEVWTTGDGCRLLIRDMETKHLLHCLRIMFERAHSKMKIAGLEPFVHSLVDVINGGDDYRARVDRVANEMFPQYMPMKLEMEIRAGKRQRDKKQDEGRDFDLSL